jgi:predicted membrane-bound dolichyl-phosphate-mannose-protein mannosyltransferase
MSASEISTQVIPTRAAGNRIERILLLPPVNKHLEWILPAICCVLLFGQLLMSTRRLSQTADESVHLYAGYRALKCGDFGYSAEHPPLAKLVAATPLLATSADIDCSTPKRDETWASLDWLYAQDWDRLLTWARIAASFFAILLCVLVWMTARQMFGLTVAALSSVLLVFEPNILAHGGLVTTDMALTAAIFLTVWAFYMWSRKRSPVFLIVTGIANGLTFVGRCQESLSFRRYCSWLPLMLCSAPVTGSNGSE